MEKKMQTKIIIGSDHGGYELKNKIIKYLNEQNYQTIDIGTNNTESCDYPTIAQTACHKIQEQVAEKAILICGTGIGMSIAANKIKGIRAAVVSDTCSAKYSRLHNNTNVLCLGERIIGIELAKEIVSVWLNTGFEQGRHQKRVDMLEN